jgi:hypothetical protein
MDPRSPLLPHLPPSRLRPAHWLAIDAALSALLVLVYVTGFKALAFIRGPDWLAVLIVLVAVVPLVVRRRWPGPVLGVVVAGGALMTALSTAAHPALAVALVIYLIPLRFARRRAQELLVGAVVVTGLGLGVFAAVPSSTSSR